MTKLTGNIEYFVFQAHGVSIDFQVLGFSGSEGMSLPFEYDIKIVTEDFSVEGEKLLGRQAQMSILGTDEQSVRDIHGLIYSITQTGQDEYFRYYNVSLRPFLSLLSHRIDSRIFQHMTVKDIVSKVFKEAGLPTDGYSFALQGDYGVKEYCVQYQETDLDFVSRVLADAGMGYFFQHTKHQHTMIICDNIGAYDAISGSTVIDYHNVTGLATEQEFVSCVESQYNIVSGSVSLNDYNFENPAVDLRAEKQVGSDHELQIYFGSGNYRTKDDGKKCAVIQLEVAQRDKLLVRGNSDCRRLLPGYRFTLNRHPDDGFNREYLVTAVEHIAEQPQVTRQNAGGGGSQYNNRFTCIPVEVNYRPNYGVKKPIMQGIQTAVVVGREGEEIYTDEFGRIKVQFHWDRHGSHNEQSSCWLRVSQVLAGAGWGAMFIPRVTQEVIVDFINGDPDQPIVTGCVYNGKQMPAYALPEYKTKSVIRSHTTQEAGSGNELLLEDLKGKTQVILSNAYGHKIIQDEESQTVTMHTRDMHSIQLDDKNKCITLQTSNAHKLEMFDTETEGEGSIRVMSNGGHNIELNDKLRRVAVQSKESHELILDDEKKRISVITSDGHSVLLDDENQLVSIASRKGHSIKIDDRTESITLEDSGGLHQFKIDISGNKLLISTESGSIDLLAQSGKIAITAMDIDINAKNELNMNAGQNVSSSAGVQHNVKANLVNIEATAVNSIKGLPVQIN